MVVTAYGRRSKMAEQKKKQIKYRRLPKEPVATPKKKKVTAKKIAEWIQTTAGIITSVGIIFAAIVSLGSLAISSALKGTNDRLDGMAGQLNQLQVESTRTQLITLMSNYPDNKSEILKVADKYFNEYNGDWYVTELFEQWAADHGVDAKTLLSK